MKNPTIPCPSVAGSVLASVLAGPFLIGTSLLAQAPAKDSERLRLDDDNFAAWTRHLQTSKEENRWQTVGWRPTLAAAVSEAARADKPVLLWTMNGHPLGCT